MSDQRDGGIAWTDETWNPVRGCSRVSPGCENCYAERVAARFSGPGQPYEGLAEFWQDGDRAAEPRWTRKVRLVPEHLADPLRWKRPRRVFVNSMSDLFHEHLAHEVIAAVFGVMACAPAHTFQILTKRANRMRMWFETGYANARECVGAAERAIGRVLPMPSQVDWPLPNVWLGVSVEDQKRAHDRIPWLLDTPAAVRFLSVEPLLGPVDLTDIEIVPPDGNRPRAALDCLRGHVKGPDDKRIDWVIVGGESGPGARPCDVAWIRSIVGQCKAAGVATFVKQLGANVRDRNDVGFEAENEVFADGDDAGQPTNPEAWPTPLDIEHDVNGYREDYQGAPVRVHLSSKKGADPEEWPWDLRVQEFPCAK